MRAFSSLQPPFSCSLASSASSSAMYLERLNRNRTNIKNEYITCLSIHNQNESKGARPYSTSHELEVRRAPHPFSLPPPALPCSSSPLSTFFTSSSFFLCRICLGSPPRLFLPSSGKINRTKSDIWIGSGIAWGITAEKIGIPLVYISFFFFSIL